MRNEIVDRESAALVELEVARDLFMRGKFSALRGFNSLPVPPEHMQRVLKLNSFSGLGLAQHNKPAFPREERRGRLYGFLGAGGLNDDVTFFQLPITQKRSAQVFNRSIYVCVRTNQP